MEFQLKLIKAESVWPGPVQPLGLMDNSPGGLHLNLDLTAGFDTLNEAKSPHSITVLVIQDFLIQKECAIT